MRTTHKVGLIAGTALALYGVLAWYLPQRQRRVELQGVEDRLGDLEVTLDRLLDHLRASERAGGAVAVPAGFRREGTEDPGSASGAGGPANGGASGLLVGRTHVEVLDRFGPPTRSEGERWTYDLGGDAGALVLTFSGGVVRAVEARAE